MRTTARIRSADFRKVLYTVKSCQLVVMARRPTKRSVRNPHTRPVLWPGGGFPLRRFSMAFEWSSEQALQHLFRLERITAFPILAVFHCSFISSMPPNCRDGVVHHARADTEVNNGRRDAKIAKGKFAHLTGQCLLSSQIASRRASLREEHAVLGCRVFPQGDGNRQIQASHR